MQQQAYNFALFEEHREAPGSKKQPVVQAVPGGKSKKAAKVQAQATNVWIVVMTAVLIALTVLLLQSKATITELNGQVRDVNRQLTDAKSTYNYLSSELSERTGMERIENIAKQLGLMKIDDSQITYVRLEDSSVLTGTETPVQQFADLFQSGILSLMETLDP